MRMLSAASCRCQLQDACDSILISQKKISILNGGADGHSFSPEEPWPRAADVRQLKCPVNGLLNTEKGKHVSVCAHACVYVE